MKEDASFTGLQRAVTVSDIMRQLPYVSAAAIWAPFPWQWFLSGRDTGAVRQLATIEMMMLALLTPWMLVGIWRGLRTCRAAAWLLIVYSLATAAGLGSIIGNVGILFRLRLPFVFPLIVITAAYGFSTSRVAARLASLLSRPRIEPPPADAAALHSSV